MMKKAMEKGDIKGIKLKRSRPSLTNLLFADNSIFFLDGTIKECQNVAEVLNQYCYTYNQAIHLNKLRTFFSRKCPQRLKHNLLMELCVPEIVKTGKYLGIPSDWGESKKQMFAWVFVMGVTKLEGWKEHLTSEE